MTPAFFRTALDPTAALKTGVHPLIDALRVVNPDDLPLGDALIRAVVAASDREVAAVLGALHLFDPERQWLGAVAVWNRIARDRDANVHWSPVHDAIMTLQYQLADGLRLGLRDTVSADIRALGNACDALDLLTALQLLRFGSFDLKCTVVCRFAGSPAADAAAWSAACATWPPAARIGAIVRNSRESLNEETVLTTVAIMAK